MGPWLRGPLAAVYLSHFLILTCFPVLVLSLHCDWYCFQIQEAKQVQTSLGHEALGCEGLEHKGLGCEGLGCEGLGCEGSGLHRPQPPGLAAGPGVGNILGMCSQLVSI